MRAKMHGKNIYYTVRKLNVWLILVVVLILALCGAKYFSHTVCTQINATGKVKVEEVLHSQINRTCRAILQGDNTDYIREKLREDKVTEISVNAQAVSVLTAHCNVACTEDLKQYEHLTMDIPRGSLLGSTYWADKGTNVSFNLRVSYELSTDYQTTMEAVGINQVRYAVYLVVKATAHVTVPASVGDATYTYYVPVCETVYTGDVPNVYVADEDGTNYLDLLP